MSFAELLFSNNDSFIGVFKNIQNGV